MEYLTDKRSHETKVMRHFPLNCYTGIRLAALASSTALAALFPLHKPRHVDALAGCASLVRGDSLEAIGDAQFLTSSPQAAAIRAAEGIPGVPEDSVKFLVRASACDSVAARYKVFRIAAGDSSYDADVAIMRLGSSGNYLATARLGPNGRDYVLLDSMFVVIRSVNLGY